MNRNKQIATVSLAVLVISIMLTSNQMPIYASPTTEDDGYTYPDDASEDEKEEIDEREQEAWEEAGRPGEMDDDDNDDNGNDEEQIFTCSDGSTVSEDEECPQTGPNPYCDLVGSNYRGVCHDRKDYSETTGLYPCNDGTEKKRWQDCKDATKTGDDNTNSEIKTTIVPAPSLTATATTLAPSNTMDVTSCEAAGTSDGKIVVFDAETFRECKLHLLNDYSNTYYNGFVKECMKQVGQTEHTCVEAVKDAV